MLPQSSTCASPSTDGEQSPVLSNGCATAQTQEELSIRDHFLNPPSTHGPIPFYWWAGETLERERIAWQLDQLVAKGIRQTVISYPHDAKGHTAMGDPLLFSPEWWDLFRWFLGACQERGMTVGFQDYTLVEPILLAIGQHTPGMQGGQMSCVGESVKGATTVQLCVEPGAFAVAAWAYPCHHGQPQIDAAVSLIGSVNDGVLDWTAPAGDWWVAMVFVRPNAFDPMHPDAGKLAIDQLYAPFERECPGAVGKTLNLFFQDELGFGSRMPFWSNQLLAAFSRKKGYDLTPLLPALWFDLGSITEKVRLDYADVVVTCLEDCYFRPIFAWHDSRGIMFGHDNSGRGRMAQGRSFYGDYFRTMRWFSAPGCDDPKLHGPRAFKGLKVNSSIAHLYQRPRVWIEAFHSSGWGTQPAEVMAALNEDFAYGATVVNLHGLYYSTRAGWWEWAPPDFHFRQPYWQHATSSNQALTRLSWLLCQGVHRCDVGIVYPIDSLDAEAADPSRDGVIAHVENEKVGAASQDPIGPEDTAFVLGKDLFDHACDFDFVDFESIAVAEVNDGVMQARTATYRVLVFPAMKAMRHSTLVKARDFVRAGGLVIAFGCLPKASDRAGRDDAELDALLHEIFGSCDDSQDQRKVHESGGVGVYLAHGYARVREHIDALIHRDVISSMPLQVLHREIGTMDAYFIYNASDDSVSSNLQFRKRGAYEIWDARDGKMTHAACDDSLKLQFAPRQATLVVRTRWEESVPATTVLTPVASSQCILLDGRWDVSLIPTLDNRYGDFSLPASAELLGPQTRRFLCSDDRGEQDDWQQPCYDDREWTWTTFSYGPQCEVAGPLPPACDFTPWSDAEKMAWVPYAYSRRWGIESDPFLTDWLSGPHGLKGLVPDEYLDFHADQAGSIWYVRAQVNAPQAGEYRLVAGARCRYKIWINGTLVAQQKEEWPPGRYEPWGIPHYESPPCKTQVSLAMGENQMVIKLVQPEGQRTRAYVAFDPPAAPPEALALRWFTDDSTLRPALMAAPERRAIRYRFLSPPGVREMTFVARGVTCAWADGQEVTLEIIERLEDGCTRYRGIVEAPKQTPAMMALRIEAPADSHAGDALPEPIRYHCGAAQLQLGDWCAQGLESYSGMIRYTRKIQVPAGASRVTLDLGKVAASAEVQVNGMTVASLMSPPWSCDLTPGLQKGENEISVIVANTLANHYRWGIPSPYAFSHQTPSGLMGPVRLTIH
jgi:hypothetical protein